MAGNRGGGGGDWVGVGIQFGLAVVGGCCWPEEETEGRTQRRAGVKNSVLWPKAPAPLITRAICLQLHGVCFRSDAQKPSHLFPDPLACVSSAGISRRVLHAGGIPTALARTWGSTRLRNPLMAGLRPRPAAASPSALIKTCEMERLARAAPFYLQHLSCC